MTKRNWTSIGTDAISAAAALAFGNVLIAVVTGKFVTVPIALSYFAAETVLGSAVFFGLLGAAALVLPRVFGQHQSRAPLVLFLIPLATSWSWHASLLPFPLCAKVSLTFTAVVLVASLIVPRLTSGFDRSLGPALAASGLFAAGGLYAIHRTAGGTSESAHPYAIPAGYVAACALASIVVWRFVGRRGAANGSRMRPAFAAVAAVTLLCVASLGFNERRSERPWNDLFDQPAPSKLPADAPNVVLISLDTVRADHLDSYGYERSTSPTISRLAEAGARFDQSISTAPWTLPAHSAMFSSMHPGSLPNFTVKGRPTLTTLLRSRGYRTAAVTGGRFVNQRRFGDGFEFFDDRNEDAYILGITPVFCNILQVGRRGLRFFDIGTPVFNALNSWRLDETGAISAFATSGRGAQLAANWIETVGPREPFFLFFHTFLAHEYYLSLAPMRAAADTWASEYEGWLRGTSLQYGSKVPSLGPHLDYFEALYDGSITIVDRFIQQILDALEAAGVTDETLVLVTADHGEGFRPDLGRVWHRARLHDDLVRVPLVIRFPGRVEPGQSIERTVSTLDLTPTILDLIDLPKLPTFHGQSLAPLMDLSPGAASGTDSQASEYRDYAFSNLCEYRDERWGWSLRWREQKYISSGQRGEEYYDLKSDPGEERDIYSATDPAQVEHRERALNLSDQFGSAEITSDPETLETLRALGYLDD